MAVCPSVLQNAEPAEYIHGRTAVQPANGIPLWHRLAFYNIGWLSRSKKPEHTKDCLAKEICDMVRELTLDAVGISEVYNLKDDDKDDERQIKRWAAFCGPKGRWKNTIYSKIHADGCVPV